MSLKKLLKDGPKVINIGIEQFYIDHKACEVPTVRVDWKPPLADKELLGKLKKLRGGNFV
ncbi:MAG TPA: hypothetical protein PK411_07430 [Mesotoga infera]|jgi:hypothetical protein|nr:hypothetical protein [Mesotoga sp.]NLI05717.1 hypothetical protein [Thermotogaceae bacterium]HNS67687.1 hypothetical protein [Mesotoga infera]HOI33715.1 hypothetical protein [Mesotoga infera]HON28614.1 hypothetical protein [Mesotoga infera]